MIVTACPPPYDSFTVRRYTPPADRISRSSSPWGMDLIEGEMRDIWLFELGGRENGYYTC
eukprot:gene5481-14575_t